MDYLFTVFTPTHNRAHLIGRLYESLLRQTYTNFKWLIVDDGSKDNTKEVVDSFIKQSKMKIDYHFIEDGFLQKAMKYSAEVLDTPYIIRVDDDDELTDNCLEVFKSEFEKLEKEGITDIGEIRALSILDDGTIAGQYQPALNQPPLDTTYTERHLNKKTQLENIECRKAEVWKQIFRDSDAKCWLYDKVNYINDSVFWFRLSKLCRTRYIWIPLRKYHDTQISLIHNLPQRTEQNLYNNVLSDYLVLNELRDYYFKYPWSCFIKLCIYAINGFTLKLNYGKLCTSLESPLCRFMFVLITPLTWLRSVNREYKIS